MQTIIVTVLKTDRELYVVPPPFVLFYFRVFLTSFPPAKIQIITKHIKTNIC
jgi:hypothetical protein